MGNIVFPSLTDQMVLGVFKYLVDSEIRKSVPVSGHVDFRHGCQEGMIAALGIMFGTNSDDVAETAYDSGGSWMHVIEEICADLTDWKDSLEAATDASSINFSAMMDAVDEAVNKYALANPRKLGEALRASM